MEILQRQLERHRQYPALAIICHLSRFISRDYHLATDHIWRTKVRGKQDEEHASMREEEGKSGMVGEPSQDSQRK